MNGRFFDRLIFSIILPGLFFASMARVNAAWPTNLFAPYVDFTSWPPYDLVGAATNTGLRHATLAFIVADPAQNGATAPATNIPAWGGYTAYSAASGYRVSDIAAFRALGGDVVISFGGASGTELAAWITDTNRLQAAYQFVISQYSATRIDFDIEGALVADAASVQRRSKVMAALQADAAAAGRPLQISLTLPVLPSGLDNNGLAVVRSALTNGVDLACVNIMAMDYGDSAAPNPAGHMGDYAVMAATNLFGQLKSVYQAANLTKTDAQLWQMVGVTPMLGVNDVITEVFDQSAAAQLVGYAMNKNFGMLAFWSLNRDRPGQSGLTQTAYQFTGIFLPFAGGGSLLPVIAAGDASVILPTNGTATLNFPVSLSFPSTGEVSVAYFTSDGTAVSPVDYYFTNGTLTFAAGQTAKTASVIVPGRTNAGPVKNFHLNLTNATGANLFATQATGTITNTNSSGGPGGNTNGGSGGECALTTQWLVTYEGAAFRATLTVGNPNSTNITLNMLTFDAPWTSVNWIACDANLANWVVPAHSGDHFTASGWNPAAVISAGGSLQLTIQATPGGSPPAPANLAVNGVMVGTCGGTLVYITSVLPSEGGVFLAWTTIGGATNRVMMSTDLVNWTSISGAIVVPGTGSVATNWSDSSAGTNQTPRFYRISVAH